MLNNYFLLARKVRRFLGENTKPVLSITDFTHASAQIITITRFFYLFITFYIYSSSSSILKFGQKIPQDPLWPIAILGEEIFVGHGASLFIFSFVTALAASILPASLLFRAATFLSLFFITAFNNSFGSISHSMHFVVFVSFLFIFLPNQIKNNNYLTRTDRLSAIAVFWWIQSILLLSYTLAGTLKVLSTGTGLFVTDGLMRTVLTRAIPNGGSPLAFEQIVSNNSLVTQFFYLGNIYIQLISIFVLFRPNLHKLYGCVLIMFHFGTFILLQIKFTPHIIIWGLFFVMSPLAPKSFSLLDTLKALPIVGLIFKPFGSNTKEPLMNEHTAYLVYDGECPFCTNYTHMLNVKDKIKDFRLINARDGGEIVEKIKAIPFDINEGMVLVYGDDYYFGSDALHMMSLLSTGSGFWGTLNKYMFKSPTVAKVVYPFMRFGRNMTLKLIGVKKLDFDH